MKNKFINSVERNKAASKLCKQLFPLWCNPPRQGELQRVISLAWENNLSEEQILSAGNWWLWMRKQFIDNTITKEQKDELKKIAVSAASGDKSINIISARSPELLHAQVREQGDKNLPRSRQAIGRLAKLVAESSEFLPTTLTILFADLAIDNFDKISEVCNVEEIANLNILKLKEISTEIGLDNCIILKISDLIGPRGKLGHILAKDGSPLIPIPVSEHGEKLIQIVALESIESHHTMFGWNTNISVLHTRNIAITMGLVGETIRSNIPNAIIIHNEKFIARGALNNLFKEPKDAIPVVVLSDLLETKKAKD